MTFDDRFRNWVVWCRRREGYGRVRCGSAESWYRTPQPWHEIVEARVEEPVEVDALVLNRAFCRLPGRVRKIIKVLYFGGHRSPKWQALELGVLMIELPELGLRARRLFSAGVDELERLDENARTVEKVRRALGALFARNREPA